MVGGLDVLGRSLSRKHLEVEVRGKESTTRGLWSSGVLVACGDTSPGVVARGEQLLGVEAATGLWGRSLGPWFVGGD